MANVTSSVKFRRPFIVILATVVVVFLVYGWILQPIRLIENYSPVASPEKEQVLQGDASIPVKYYKLLLDLSSDIKNYWLYFRTSIANTELKNETMTVDDGYVAINSGLRRLMEIISKERLRRLKTLSDLVRGKILKLQFPRDCKKARLLIYDVDSSCGFGCSLHSLITAFLQAFVSGRTMILRSKGWHYANEGWEYAFCPVTNCTNYVKLDSLPRFSEENDMERVVGFKGKTKAELHWLHWSIPTQLEAELKELHGHSYAWWLSRFVSYVFLLQPWMEEKLLTMEKEINFTSSVVGIHVRWGDKIVANKPEAKKHQVEEYMMFVERWFEQRQHAGQAVNKVVYVATETPAVILELKRKYPDYKFIESGLVTEKIIEKKERYHHGGLESVIADIYFLSKCDYLVCTLSSSVCRTAYELLNDRHGDATTRFQSVDLGFRLKNLYSQPWVAIMDHNSTKPGELTLRKGDEIIVYLNPHVPTNDGFLSGTNQRTKQGGKFPLFKAREQVFTYNVSELNNITFPWRLQNF